MMKATWDIITAQKCRLPELIPDICTTCRDYAYCHRQEQITIFDLINERMD